MELVKKMLYARIGMKKDISNILEAHEAQDADRLVRILQTVPKRSLDHVLKVLKEDNSVFSANVSILYHRKQRAFTWYEQYRTGDHETLRTQLKYIYPYLVETLFNEILHEAAGDTLQRLTRLTPFIQQEQHFDVLFDEPSQVESVDEDVFASPFSPTFPEESLSSITTPDENPFLHQAN